MKTLDSYAQFCGQGKINEIYSIGERLSGQSVVHVNSTFYGGGVAEMLGRYVPLLNDAGVDAEWRLLKGSDEFFSFTKRLHNGLQGAKMEISKEDVKLYESTLAHNASFTHLHQYDAVIIDDPQPAGLINYYPKTMPSLFKPLPVLLSLSRVSKKQSWLWRAHIDLSCPDRRAASFLRRYVSKYDGIIVSSEKYRILGGRKPRYVIQPAIDPLSFKNRPISDALMRQLLSKHALDSDKPMIAQVSRFDPWKDPLGVIDVYKKVKEKADCQLVLLGNFATDDSEGVEIYRRVADAAVGDRDIHVVAVDSELLVNAVQRRADVVLQKSSREGFGLTVTEAMWKGTPVVANAVGGIPLQIEDGKSGFLVRDNDECAARVLQLLKNRKLSRKIGKAAKERVRSKFLVTRIVEDELRMLENVLGKRPSLSLKAASSLMSLPMHGASGALGAMARLGMDLTGTFGFGKIQKRKK